MKVITIIQARTSSSRLPNKALMDVYGTSLLERVIRQAQAIEHSDELWVATSTNENDDLIEILCDRLKVNVHRGSLKDVRSRFSTLAKERKADLIVRVTADNPLTEPEYADQLIQFLKDHEELDYVTIDKTRVVNGTNSEVFTKDALQKSETNYFDESNKEHVVPAMIQKMRVAELIPSNLELIAEKPYFAGIDTFSDLYHVTNIYKKFGEKNTLKKLIGHINNNEETV